MIKTNFAVLMAERGLKIADVFEDTGISKTTLMALAENTGKGVQFDTVDKLCNYLGVELKDFFVYVPYIWEMHFKKHNSDENSYYIVVKLKTKNTEKDYFLQIWARHPKNYDFPLDDDSFKLWLSISLEESDAYDDKDFFQFLTDLPISMKTAFYAQFLDLTIENLLKKDSQIPTFCDFWEADEKVQTNHKNISLTKGDKVYLAFFSDTYSSLGKNLENTKIITVQ
ncbi:TPA: helix-turn-helix transcriptional regulator [Streptococcus suis]|nr:helix-turn-helix transcriptional regulator [Streptococcus suis]